MAHQLEQHNTDTAMLSDQRTLFKEAFDAQATLLANSVGSASVASEVRCGRFSAIDWLATRQLPDTPGLAWYTPTGDGFAHLH